MQRRDLLSAAALAASVSAAGLPPAAAAPMPARMKLGAVLMSGMRGRGEAGAPGAEGPRGARPPAAPPAVERMRSIAPRDPEQGFKALGRWGIRNVVSRAQIAGGRLFATV
ncbi:MAG: hypothetical protein JNK48_23030, partial [Bryobacterales bacterium]|nr:hypothetical protein [Bryobacterales bacterium]